MQGYEKIVMTKDDIVPTAQRMRDEGRRLVMIHGFLTDNGFNVSYEYEVGSNVESYTVETAESLPSSAGPLSICHHPTPDWVHSTLPSNGYCNGNRRPIPRCSDG